jgi:hypothetical protein
MIKLMPAVIPDVIPEETGAYAEFDRLFCFHFRTAMQP